MFFSLTMGAGILSSSLALDMDTLAGLKRVLLASCGTQQSDMTEFFGQTDDKSFTKIRWFCLERNVRRDKTPKFLKNEEKFHGKQMVL